MVLTSKVGAARRGERQRSTAEGMSEENGAGGGRKRRKERAKETKRV